MYDVVTALAWAQQGAFSTSQAVARGVSHSWLRRRVHDGFVTRPVPGVYVLADAPPSARQTVMVHVLGAGDGALATADTALGLWCDELTLPRRPVLAVPRSCGYRHPGAVVRRSTDLHLAVPGRVDGIPVVGVVRALIDAAAGRSVDEVLRLLDVCRRQLAVAPGALADGLREHARPGRPGVATFRQALRSLGRTVTDSEFERLVVRDLVAAGIERPRLHHLVRTVGEAPIELDLDWPGALLDVELDGRDHVDRAAQARRDRTRDRVLQLAGYVVLRYTWDDYVAARPRMLDDIGRALATARSGGRRLVS